MLSEVGIIFDFGTEAGRFGGVVKGDACHSVEVFFEGDESPDEVPQTFPQHFEDVVFLAVFFEDVEREQLLFEGFFAFLDAVDFNGRIFDEAEAMEFFFW